MSVREYIGARYVPLFMGEWNIENTYEPLSIVIHEGNSYTSRQFVPAGIAITNNVYWAETGNYNAQIEQYRQEVLGFSDRIEAVETAMELVEPVAENLEYTKEQYQLFYGLRNNNNPEKLIQIAETYMDNNDKLFYGDSSYLGKTKQGDNWVFNSITGRVENGQVKFPMSCSSLVLSSLIGIPYEKSRMANGTGSITVSGTEAVLLGGINYKYAGAKFMNEDTNSEAATKFGSLEGTLHSWQLAEYLDTIGYLNHLEELTDLRPGDILFYENWTGSAPHYLNINHCEIFIGFNTTTAGTNLIAISGESSGNYCQFVVRPITGTMIAMLKHFARVDSPHFPVRNLFEGVDTTAAIVSNAYHTIRLADETTPLKANKAYTLIFKLSENSKEYLPAHFNIYLYNGSVQYTNLPAYFYVDNVYNEIAPNTYACVIRTTGINDAIAIQYQMVENKSVDFKVEWVALYDGIVSW